MLGIAPESPASGAPQKMSEHHFEREKQGALRKYTPKRQASKPKKAMENAVMRFPWCTVVFGRIDLRIGGVRVEVKSQGGWERRQDDAKRPRWES